MKLIDTHSHIQEKEFDAVRVDVLHRMRAAGVGTIVVGCDYESSKRAVELAMRESDVWASIGMHPVDTQDMFDISLFTGLLGAKKGNGSPAVVAVGECGLDYFRLTGSTDEVHTEKERQTVSFKSQIDFALAYDLPLMLHVRASKGTTDAHDDALAILAAYAGQATGGSSLRGTAHFFTATTVVAQQYFARGFHVSFPGVITFAAELEDVVRAAPRDRILLETDSPYAAPVPHRGQQNEPSFVVEVAHAVARIQGAPVIDIVAQTTMNAQKLFRL